jgi:hypothetical protein
MLQTLKNFRKTTVLHFKAYEVKGTEHLSWKMNFNFWYTGNGQYSVNYLAFRTQIKSYKSISKTNNPMRKDTNIWKSEVCISTLCVYRKGNTAQPKILEKMFFILKKYEGQWKLQ